VGILRRTPKPSLPSIHVFSIAEILVGPVYDCLRFSASKTKRCFSKGGCTEGNRVRSIRQQIKLSCGPANLNPVSPGLSSAFDNLEGQLFSKPLPSIALCCDFLLIAPKP
jgi:hypothetical protein